MHKRTSIFLIFRTTNYTHDIHHSLESCQRRADTSLHVMLSPELQNTNTAQIPAVEWSLHMIDGNWTKGINFWSGRKPSRSMRELLSKECLHVTKKQCKHILSASCVSSQESSPKQDGSEQKTFTCSCCKSKRFQYWHIDPALAAILSRNEKLFEGWLVLTVAVRNDTKPGAETKHPVIIQQRHGMELLNWFYCTVLFELSIFLNIFLLLL